MCLDSSLDSGASPTFAGSAVASTKASSVLSAEGAPFANPRLTNHARLHQSVRCPLRVMRRGPLNAAFRYPHPGLRDLPDRFSSGGALGVQHSFRRFNPTGGRCATFAAISSRMPFAPSILTDRFRRLIQSLVFLLFVHQRMVRE